MKYQVTAITVVAWKPWSNVKIAHFFLRTEVKEKAAELDILKDTMAGEQKKSRELQWALEKEKAKMERSEERRREELEVNVPGHLGLWKEKEHINIILVNI